MGRKGSPPLLLQCQILLLVLLISVKLSMQQVDQFFSSCQEVSAQGTIPVSIQEADAQFLIDSNRLQYRTGLRLSANPSTTGLQFDVNTTTVIPPNQYFVLENGPRSDGIGGREWFLQLIRPIDRDGALPTSFDDQNVFEFTLQCTDLQLNTAFFILLRVQMIDVNDNAPVFVNDPYFVSVNELTPIGTTVFRGISASDLDYGKNKDIVFNIQDGTGGANDGSLKFAIDISSQGFITVEETIDFEPLFAAGNTTYVLQIRARDSATVPRSALTTLTINVTDGDDQKPVFEYPTCTLVRGRCFNPAFSASIISLAGVSSVVPVYPIPSNNPASPVQISARDQDTLSYVINYSIDQTIPAGYESYFQMDASRLANVQTPGRSASYASALRLVRPINRNNVQELRVVIRAEEAGFNRRYERATIFVRVDPANANPPIVSTSSGSFIGYIREDALSGSFVMNQLLKDAIQLVVTDPDLAAGETQDYTYSVTGTTAFRVDQNGFIRFTTGNLDYKSNPRYSFTITVTESNTVPPRFATTSLTVNVIDVNDKDPFFIGTPYSVSKPEGDYSQGAQEPLVTLNAQDIDTFSQTFSYGIVDVSDNAASKFILTGNTIFLRGLVVAGEEYVITVNVSDSGVPPRQGYGVVYVRIISAGNKGPQIPSALYTIYVSEGVAQNSQIFLVPATDPEDNPLNFAITNGNVGNMFSIDGRSRSVWRRTPNGQVTNLGDLDRESVPEYNLTITATDQFLSASTVLRVILTDVNDQTPQFSSPEYRFTVAEGQPQSTLVGTVAAFDRDLAGSSQATFQFGLLRPNSDFRVDPSSGQILTNRPLAYETVKEYQFVVTAIDAGLDPRTGLVTVFVSVTDVQDSIPLFVDTNYEGSIRENLNGASVLTVTAIDADTIPNIRYRFSSGDFSSFNINENSGLITTSVPLNYEQQQRYVMEVTASDNIPPGLVSATATVTINVIDQNDFTPVGASCQEVSAQGTIPVSIQEADAQFLIDSNRLQYRAGLRLSANPSTTGLQFDVNTTSVIPPNQYFVLENGPRSDGIGGREWFLQLIRPIDRDGALPTSFDDQNVFEFTLQCTDLQLNTAFFILLRVQMMDVNDNSPVFVNAPYSITINELIPVDSVIFRGVSAYDLDYGPNKDIHLDFVDHSNQTNSGTTKFSFQIPSHGFVSVKEPVDFESMLASGTTDYVLTIRVRDAGTPPRSSFTTLTVTVADGDDLGPVFVYDTCISGDNMVCVNPSYTTTITDDTQLGPLQIYPYPINNPPSPIFIEAKDGDTLNYEIEYNVMFTEPSGYEDYFDVSIPETDSHKAELLLTKPIPDTAPRDLRLILIAKEISSNQRSERAVIYVTIQSSGETTQQPCSSSAISVTASILTYTFTSLFIWALQ